MAEVVKVIGSGGDIADLKLWLADIGTNGQGWYSQGDVAVGRLAEQQTANGPYNIVEAAPDTIVGARLEPVPGLEHNGIPGSGVGIFQGAPVQTGLQNTIAATYDFELRDLEFFNSNPENTRECVYWRSPGNVGTMIAKRCLAHGAGGANTTTGFYSWTDTDFIAVRCHAWNCGTTGFRKCVMRFCSFDGYGLGVESDGSDANDNIVMAGVPCFGGNLTGTYNRNMSSDGTAPGTVNYPNETRALIWTDPDNGDWSLLPGTNARGTGVDPGTYPYDENIDITNTVVSGDWDLGAYQSSVAPPPPGIPVSGQRRLHTFGL